MMWSLLRASPKSWPLQAISPAGESASACATVWGCAACSLSWTACSTNPCRKLQILQLLGGQALELGRVAEGKEKSWLTCTPMTWSGSTGPLEGATMAPASLPCAP